MFVKRKDTMDMAAQVLAETHQGQSKRIGWHGQLLWRIAAELTPLRYPDLRTDEIITSASLYLRDELMVLTTQQEAYLRRLYGDGSAKQFCGLLKAAAKLVGVSLPKLTILHPPKKQKRAAPRISLIDTNFDAS